MREIYEDLDFFSFEVGSKRDILDFWAIYAKIAMMYVTDITTMYNTLEISICLFMSIFYFYLFEDIYELTA